MAAWEVHVHTDDEEKARNLTEELHAEGFGVSLFKNVQREQVVREIQFALLPLPPHKVTGG